MNREGECRKSIVATDRLNTMLCGMYDTRLHVSSEVVHDCPDVSLGMEINYAMKRTPHFFWTHRLQKEMGVEGFWSLFPSIIDIAFLYFWVLFNCSERTGSRTMLQITYLSVQFVAKPALPLYFGLWIVLAGPNSNAPNSSFIQRTRPFNDFKVGAGKPRKIPRGYVSNCHKVFMENLHKTIQ